MVNVQDKVQFNRCYIFCHKCINIIIFKRLLLIEGAETYANSVKYKGEFKNNKRSGKGLKDVLGLL